MKKVVFTLAFVAMSIMTMAQQWVGINGNTPAAPQVKLISSNENNVVVDFSLSGFTMTKVSTPNGIQQVISVPKMASMLEAGAPDLPHYPVPAIIGDAAEMEVHVTNCIYKDYQNVEVAPSKGNFSRQIDPETVPYTYGAMYQTNAFYPATQAYLESPYIFRDFRGQDIMVRPFAYNPVTKTLRVFTNMTIEMSKVGNNGANQKGSRKSIQKVAPEMKEAYSHRFINYKDNGAKYNFITDRGEMLVICPDTYMDFMQSFVDWKNQSGRPTTIVSLSEVGGNNDNTIKNYINSIYTNPERNLLYVLLVGDYSDLTPHSMSGGRSDNWFGQLEGSDYYLEVLTGRFSVQTMKDLETHIEKVLYYERDMPEGLTWLNQGIGIGANEGAGQGHNGGEADYVHVNYIRDTLMHYTYENVTQQYSGVGGGTNANAISADFNAGVSICNYCNHGSQTSWAVANYSNSNVNALINDDKWPYIWSVACNNGEFNGNCFGEAWMRATNEATGRPTGAVGGMFSWISQPWVPPMTGQDEMVNILTGWKHEDQFNHTLGGASLNGSMYMLDMHPSDQGNTHNTWILFGDPSLMVRTDNPVSMNLNLSPAILMLGMTELEISAENTEYGIATLMMDGEIIATADIQDGVANMNFSPLSNVGTATLTVIGYNKVTEVLPIEILPAEGAYITFNDVQCEQPLVTGAYVAPTISLKNVGVETANNIDVVLSTDSEYIELITTTATVPSIAPDEVYEIADAFAFNVDVEIPNNTKVRFFLNCTAGEDEWENKFDLTFGAPDFAVSNISNTDLTPGGNGTITFDITNNGGANAENCILEVYSSSNDLVFENSTYEIPGIAINEVVSIPVNLTVGNNVEIGATYEISYLLTSGHYSVWGNYIATVGNIVEGFETGDFSMYDWQFSGANWTVVSGEANSGTYSVRSGAIPDNQQSDLILTTEVLADGEISFYKKVSSENSYDKLFFYIDNVEKGNWSGEVSWSQQSYPVAAGTHTFRWTYKKDVSMSSGSDCAWVDDIQFPPTSITLALDPITDFEVFVDENNVELSWTGCEGATAYVIHRNGEEIANQAGTTYTEVVEDGVYTYSVVATNGNGLYSTPEFLTVSVGTVSVEEQDVNEFGIYPNPVSSTLNINGGNAEYSYMMFNGMGQMVANGKAQGTEQINVNDMAKGVYFLRITTGTQVRVEKVVVK